MNFTSRLDYLSQFSNAVIPPDTELKVRHYQAGQSKKKKFILPLTSQEIAQRQKWREEQIERLKANESTAVMSFLIKEHNV